MSKKNEIYKYSNPPEVYRLASKYLGKKAKIGLSTFDLGFAFTNL
jgi:hypothetical protein